MDEREERIRRRAHELWVLDGMPEGMEQEHWYRAEDIVRTEDFDAFLANPNPASEVLEQCECLNPDPAARPIGEQPPASPKPRARPAGRAQRDPLLPLVAVSGRRQSKSQGGSPWNRH